ncbi:hypothetical protein [Rossellomorea marisflavi]|uniref:Uncharacterized protein n=1 Tax=Rossellomorea marisflavi TaxID=189381 RepID=A0A161TKD9_9BACI|nr:hypothetical protein [Rossellomorea marisflavi]KZE51860.1 hypothetical protein AV649_13695 [Rossellomorea marisflavi]
MTLWLCLGLIALSTVLGSVMNDKKLNARQKKRTAIWMIGSSVSLAAALATVEYSDTIAAWLS